MLSPSHGYALNLIYTSLNNKDIVWALTGSTALIVHGMQLPANDIDIMTNEAGAYKIGELLKEFEIMPVSFSSTDKIRSHFGRYNIGGVSVEIMGDVQIKQNDTWSDVDNLTLGIEHINYKNMMLPTLGLTREKLGYERLGRHERVREIMCHIVTLRR